MCKAVSQLMQEYYKEGAPQRLGQYFFNTYIKSRDASTDDIFYESDINKARVKISQFMMNNQWHMLPKKLVDSGPTASRFLNTDGEVKLTDLYKDGKMVGFKC